MSTTEPTRVRVRPGVYQRINGDGTVVFEVAYRDSDGRQRRETVGPRMKAAEARLAQVKADMSRGGRVARRAEMTVASAAETWLASTGHLRSTTVRAYGHALRDHVLPAFGHRRLEAVKPDDVARWAQRAMTLAYAAEHGRSVIYRARTVNLALTTLDRVYAHAIRRQGYAGASPVRALERSERPRDEPKAMVILTPEQTSAIVAASDPLYRPLLAFLVGTGVRIGEALGLTWADVNVAERTARIAMQVNREGRRVSLKTSNGRRTLELHGPLVALLAEHKLAAEDKRPGVLVFASGSGSAFSDRNVATRGLKVACQRTGVPVISPHALRHAHASALLADGWDLAAVSRRLGHGSVAITASTYAHLIEDDARRQERRASLDRLYGPTTLAVV